MTAIYGEYVTFKHVKTRKVVVLEIEVPEESFESIIQTLGMPIGGESKPVGVALLDKKVLSGGANKEPSQRTLSQKAYLLSQRGDFGRFAHEKGFSDANKFIYQYCGIESKSELDVRENAIQIDAFLQLQKEFDAWKLEEDYRANLYR